MNTLKKGQLINVRNEIFDLIIKSSKTRSDLVTKGKITRTDSLKIAEREESLQKIANELNLALLSEVVADIQEPGNKIITATNNVNAAITQLQDINKFLGILAAFISMASTIVVAFSTGNPLKLAGLLDEIEAFT
jgi:hypothetical protein